MSSSRRSAAAAAALALVAALAPLSAQAREPRDAPADPPPTTRCALERVDDRFVRCDDDSGAGQPAPSWIPVRDPHPDHCADTATVPGFSRWGSSLRWMTID
jgi:hypothetical protein